MISFRQIRDFINHFIHGPYIVVEFIVEKGFDIEDEFRITQMTDKARNRNLDFFCSFDGTLLEIAFGGHCHNPDVIKRKAVGVIHHTPDLYATVHSVRRL